MTKCLQCKKEIPEAERRLKFAGTINWAMTAGDVSPSERVLAGSAEFCSIRCLGTFIGVTLQSRGLKPPKSE